ncbi:hypothetical protein DV737_g2341, partial [Chaetothyriales sp. CBS 132003]
MGPPPFRFGRAALSGAQGIGTRAQAWRRSPDKGTKQPEAPEAYEAPLRELEFGQINFLHTTDIHGWHAGHLSEPSYSADWGDYVDFASQLRRRLESEGKDLLVIDTGDRIEGNGLSDASDPKGKFTYSLLQEQHVDLLCLGNHELYKQNSSENDFNITVPAFGDRYLASNVDIHDPTTGDIVPFARRFKKFTTPKQGIRIIAFGFLFDFKGNYNNTIVRPVADAVTEDWFQTAIRDREVDLFVVIGHAALRSEEFNRIFKAIRSVRWDTPIQFFGGHFHIRDYKKFDAKAYGLASGRFMETIGFQSIDGLSSHPKFFRRYIDNNLYSLYHHSRTTASSFHTDHGRHVSRLIRKARASLGLNIPLGCAPQDLWMSRAKYPSNSSIFTWLEKDVIPRTVRDPSRSEVPRLILTNTGAIRFDIFEGPFTTDSAYIISPFTSGFHFIKDVPYAQASKLLGLLNHAGQIFMHAGRAIDMSTLAPPQQWQLQASGGLTGRGHGTPDTQQQFLTSSISLRPGYTTKDDAGDDGDDTLHSPISFYEVPNCIQSLVNFTHLEEGDAKVDLVFNEFIQPYILFALAFLGLDYSDKDVSVYLDGETFTSVIANWISQNWHC